MSEPLTDPLKALAALSQQMRVYAEEARENSLNQQKLGHKESAAYFDGFHSACLSAADRLDQIAGALETERIISDSRLVTREIDARVIDNLTAKLIECKRERDEARSMFDRHVEWAADTAEAVSIRGVCGWCIGW